VERRAYNLRPRKDDSVAIQRRSEFARLRQRRNKRKEEIRAYEGITRFRLQMAKILSNKSDEVSKDRSKCLTPPPSYSVSITLNTVTDYALSFTPCS
jgi:hypothetical protein